MKKVILIMAAYFLLSFKASAENRHEDHDHDFEFIQRHVHQHGKVVATISYSQNQIDLYIKLPAYNAFGFEYSPSNKNEQSIVDSTLEKLSIPINIIEFDPNCSVISIDPLKSHEQATATNEDEHYDIELEYSFSCPSNKTISASFTLFKAIPNIDQIEDQNVSDKQQKIVTVDAENDTLKIH
jgi:hypothetical protein